MDTISDADALRVAAGQFATGVTVFTVRRGDTVHGMTANAFASLSLRPPLVLLCVRADAATAKLLEGADGMAVSILREDQTWLAAHFADPGRPAGGGQFRGLGCAAGPVTGAPLVPGALAWLELKVRDVLPGGDHVITVGRVLGVATGYAAPPLIFHRSRFHQLGDQMRTASRGGG
jgi:flavin reductase (DIM6/NTAB) family NADH-FMN oxidoreductase RutF